MDKFLIICFLYPLHLIIYKKHEPSYKLWITMYHTHEYIYPIQTVKTKGPSDLKPWPAGGQADHMFILFNDLEN